MDTGSAFWREPPSNFKYNLHLQRALIKYSLTQRTRYSLITRDIKSYKRETCWLNSRFDADRPKGRGFDSRFSHQVKSLGKSFARSCLWRFGIKLRHSIRALSGAPLSSSGLGEAL